VKHWRKQAIKILKRDRVGMEHLRNIPTIGSNTRDDS